MLGEDSGSEVRVLPLYDADSEAKWVAAGDMLAGADYVVIASRRAYRALAGWPERYPLTARYYRLLFEGRLGFEPVACFGRAPRLGDLLAFVDDPAAGLGFVLPDECRSQAAIALNLGPLDESLVVYDHPQVIIFRRTATAPDGAALAALLSSGL
ncbi:MAG: hypothetical protein GX601_19915 [Anaerolineales bacterium]|nr:hypothetical protein [Anaerolineales bacterium]